MMNSRLRVVVMSFHLRVVEYLQAVEQLLEEGLPLNLLRMKPLHLLMNLLLRTLLTMPLHLRQMMQNYLLPMPHLPLPRPRLPLLPRPMPL
jgi:hypothetical protein